MFGKSLKWKLSNEPMQAIIKKHCPMHNAIYNLVLCMGQSDNFDYVRKSALSQNNIRLQLFLRHGATKMCNQNMPAKCSCV